jgi:hypothetical protein
MELTSIIQVSHLSAICMLLRSLAQILRNMTEWLACHVPGFGVGHCRFGDTYNHNGLLQWLSNFLDIVGHNEEVLSLLPWPIGIDSIEVSLLWSPYAAQLCPCLVWRPRCPPPGSSRTIS